MAIDVRNHYWVYTLTLTDDQLDELEGFVQQDKAAYVAGKLIGLFRAHGKVVLRKSKPVDSRGVNE